jgi:hypothetical protein
VTEPAPQHRGKLVDRREPQATALDDEVAMPSAERGTAPTVVHPHGAE